MAGPIDNLKKRLAEYLEPDENDNADSVFGGENMSDTTSLASSIYKNRLENGRTYHSFREGSYMYPNDSREKNRLDLQHHLFYLTFDNKLLHAPIGPNPEHVLDIGTGTGIWAIDFADAYPSAKVIGTDLSVIQPSWVPKNLTFVIDDATDPWTFPDKYDLIHMRGMVGCFTDPSVVFKHAYDALRPGGWIDFPDVAWPMRCVDNSATGTSLLKWSELMVEAAEKLGRPLTKVSSYKQMAIDVGFTNVTELVYKWPLGPWPKDPKLKEVGAWGKQNTIEALEALSLALFTKALDWSVEEIQKFLVDVRKDIDGGKIHVYSPVYVVYAQKPE